MFHFDVKYFSRRRGQAVVAAAAYRSGQRLYDYYYGEVHNYTDKSGIFHSWILLPPDAPKEYYNREILWNAVEHAEKRRDARLAREVEGAIPIELKTTDERIRLVEEYVLTNFVEHGMCADVAIHDKGDGNPHFHCLLTTRVVTPEGFGLKNRDWDKRERLEQWREEWANIQNRELERRNLEPVRHESHAAQDTELKPTIHLGYIVLKLDRAGIGTDRMREYREIIQYNRELELEHQREHEYRRNRGRER